MVLNLYPYNPGHLMVLPYGTSPTTPSSTTPRPTRWRADEAAAARVRRVSQPHAFNIGLNLGGAAGGSLPGTCTSTWCRAGPATPTS